MNLDAHLEAEILKDIVGHEGNVPWPYCDDRGFVTVGVGHLLKCSADLVALPMVQAVSGANATGEEKSSAWVRVKSHFAPGAGAIHYRDCCNLRLPDEVALELCSRRIENEFLPELSKLFRGVEVWPPTAMRAVLDIAYNCGSHWGKKFPRMVAALQGQDWAEAAKHCTRAAARRTPTPSDPEGLGPRNLWTIAMLLEAAKAVASREQPVGVK